MRFELPEFSVGLENGTWSMTPPHDVSADDRNAWADAWRRANAIRAVRHDGRSATSEIKVGMKDGRTLVLGILQREPELVLLRVDEGVQYHFFANTAKRLLSPPGRKADAARNDAFVCPSFLKSKPRAAALRRIS